MPWTTEAKNTMLNVHTALYMALFNGDPTDAGVEVSSGRVSATYNTASDGSRTLSNEPELTVSGGSSANYWALFDASTGGTMVAYDALSSTKTDDADFTITGVSGSLDLNNDA